MNVSKIRFKGYEWEHNPEKLKVADEDNLSEQKMPRGSSIAVKRSAKCRLVTGEGIITGYDCFDKFNEILKLQRSGESGILTLPGAKPFYAYFRKLELLCEPVPNTICYRFEFLEDSERNFIIEETLYHTTVSGESLWDISHNYGVKIETLVKLNPDIKRVDEIYTGRKVRIC